MLVIMDSVSVKTGPARRILADHLAEHCPEMLEDIKVFAAHFGRLEQVGLAYDDPALTKDLRTKLEDASGGKT